MSLPRPEFRFALTPFENWKLADWYELIQASLFQTPYETLRGFRRCLSVSYRHDRHSFGLLHDDYRVLENEIRSGKPLSDVIGDFIFRMWSFRSPYCPEKLELGVTPSRHGIPFFISDNLLTLDFDSVFLGDAPLGDAPLIVSKLVNTQIHDKLSVWAIRETNRGFHIYNMSQPIEPRSKLALELNQWFGICDIRYYVMCFAANQYSVRLKYDGITNPQFGGWCYLHSSEFSGEPHPVLDQQLKTIINHVQAYRSNHNG